MSSYDDPCECISTHEAMMRRLFNILRQSQEECSDGDCTTEINLSSSNAFTIGLITLLSIVAMIMFYTRPASLRYGGSSTEKQGNIENSGDRPQPPPSVG